VLMNPVSAIHVEHGPCHDITRLRDASRSPRNLMRHNESRPREGHFIHAMWCESSQDCYVLEVTVPFALIHRTSTSAAIWAWCYRTG